MVVELLVDVQDLARRAHAAVLAAVGEVRVLEGAEGGRRLHVLVRDLADVLDRLVPWQREETLEVGGDVAAGVEHAARLGRRRAQVPREVPQHPREGPDLPQGQRRPAREDDAFRERRPAPRRADEEDELLARGRIWVLDRREGRRVRVAPDQPVHEPRVLPGVVGTVGPLEQEPPLVRLDDVRPRAVPVARRGARAVAPRVAGLGDLVLRLRQAEVRVRPHVLA